MTMDSRMGSVKYKTMAGVGRYATKKYTGALKVLVSTATYSGAEMIAKILQSQGRAKIYGPSTAGAFNLTMQIPLDIFVAGVPYMKVIDAKDGVYAELIGVTPDHPPHTREYIKTVYFELENYSSRNFE
jgi:C-terminal processing protease CtpA/Prc